jgi:Protein kinase domain
VLKTFFVDSNTSQLFLHDQLAATEGQSVWSGFYSTTGSENWSSINAADRIIIKLTDVSNENYMHAANNELQVLKHLGLTSFSSILLKPSYEVTIQDHDYLAIVMADSGAPLMSFNSLKLEGIQRNAAKALTLLHQNGVLHGDIRLQNFVYRNGNVRIIDFGCSVIFEDKSSDLFKRSCLVEKNELQALFLSF